MVRPTVPRRGFLALAAGAPALGLAGRAARGQQAWPTHPITMVVPYPPGGTSDLSARTVAPRLGELLGQPVVIENRAGAGGSIGAAVVAQARPDGHTLLTFPTAVLTISPHIMDLPYDPARAFTPICMFTVAYGVIAAHPSLPFRDVAGLIAYAKAHPGSCASAPPATAPSRSFRANSSPTPPGSGWSTCPIAARRLR